MSPPLGLVDPASFDTSSRYGRFWAEFSRRPVSDWVVNIQTRMHYAFLEGQIIPITVNESELDNAYVCSPYNAVITYPLEEVRHLPSPVLRQLISALANSVAPGLRYGQINRAVTINNWLLSTNLHPRVPPEKWQPLIDTTLEHFPQHAVLIRSLNRVTDAALLDYLSSRSFLLVPSRQVYWFDGKEAKFLTRHNTRIDQQWLNRHPEYCAVEHHELQSSDFARIEELYGRLYLERYSYNNPRFTAALLESWWQHRIMTFTGLRNRQGKLDGIIGFFECDETISAPVVGYDTHLPQSLGLYRMLMALVLRETADRKLTLNLSSGAASFKRLRGGNAELEYTAVYIRHLKFRQRFAWTVLATLLEKIGAPLLKRYEL